MTYQEGLMRALQLVRFHEQSAESAFARGTGGLTTSYDLGRADMAKAIAKDIERETKR